MSGTTTMQDSIGKKVVPNENWGSNSRTIKSGVILKDYTDEWLIKATCEETIELLVYKHEVDIVENSTTTMQTLDEQKCVAGCKMFTGGEKKHHKGCPFYPESLSKYYDELEAKQQLPEIAQKEPVNFLLANALKLCTKDQLIALRDLLIERTPKQQVVIDLESELNKLTDEERHSLFGGYCRHCGSKDNSCQCWNDE